jgi:hypothetical protein
MATREDVAAFMATEVADAARQLFSYGKSANGMIRAKNRARFLRAVELKERFDSGDDDAARTIINVHIANIADDLKRLDDRSDDIPERDIAAGAMWLAFERQRLDSLFAVVKEQ